jgi:D-beta-D-heptose 7-phosphate kinase/D-beta-D-heptose 1-phosphate adenosyltransferase
LHLPAQARQVFDVSGAGDTVVAILSVLLAEGFSIEEAANAANLAAGLVVEKPGTATVTRAELIGEMRRRQEHQLDAKILTLDEALGGREDWKSSGQSVVFTNGCFDLLHPGHVSLLRRARAAGDRLVVGLNSDASVRRLKGEDRPVQDATARSIVLAALSFVDAVVVFEEDTPLKLIEALKPDVLVKGADYKPEDVVGADLVCAYGGRLVLLSLEEGHSTTGIVARLSGTKGTAKESPTKAE